MALIKRNDVIMAFKESLGNASANTMENTMAIKSAIVTSSQLAANKVKDIRDLFNNNRSQEIASHGSVFRTIFNRLDSGKKDVEGEESIEYASSGTKEENEETSNENLTKFSPDTISRNKTAYDVAGIHVQAVVAQTQIITESLSTQTTYLRNIDENVQKILDSLGKGMKQAHEDMIKSTAENSLYNEKGYLNVTKYLEQISGEMANFRSIAEGVFAKFSDPKEVMKEGFDFLFEKAGFKKFMSNIEDSVSKGFTNMIDSIGNTKLFRGNNAISKMLRNMFMPNINGADIQGSLNLNSGISESKAVAFDNITRQTIIDAIPGLLERILAQNEIVAQVLQGSTGIKGKTSGVTYDIKSGRFTTTKSMIKDIRKQYADIRKTNKIMSDGEIDLTQWADAIEPMIFYMATTNYPIQNFWKMPYSQAKDFLLWGLGRKSIPKTIEEHFNLFWNVFHSRTGNTTMSSAQRKAIEEINRLYQKMKKSIDQLNISNMNDVNSGLRRADQLSSIDGWYATEILHGRVTDFTQHSKANGYVGGTPIGGKTTSMKESATEFVSDISDSVKEFKNDIRKLVHAGVEQQGSIYVHDSVAIEYLKALTAKIAPDADLSGIKSTERIHKAEHPNEKSTPSIEKLKSRKPVGDKSYSEVETIDWEPDIVRKGKYRAMSFARDLGYHGYDNQLANSKYDDQKRTSSVGWAENLMYKTDLMRANAEIDFALNTGKISREQADELRSQLNNSSPEEYKSSLLKTIGRWSPAIIGGLAFGPFGFLSGLGIKKYLSKSNAERIVDSTKKMEKQYTREAKARTKMENDRRELEKEIQKAFTDGKLTEEERDEAMKQLSTMSPSEYKTGLKKWVLKLGPAVAASLLGFGPLGVLVGAMIGNKLVTPSAVAIRKKLKKIKPSSEVWDDDKRRKLIDDLNKKIDELTDAKNESGTQEEKDAIDDQIAQLEKYKSDIKRAGTNKLLWYTTSIPGILSMIGNIRKLPGLAIHGLGQGIRALKKSAKNIAGTAWTKLKEAAVKVYGKIFYGDVRLASEEGRQEMRIELKEKLDSNQISQSEYDKASVALDEAIEKFDSRKNLMGTISKGMRSFGKGVSFIGGIITGKTQKRAAANANRSAKEASKILYGNGQINTSAEVADISDNVSRITDAALNGNSLNVSDSGVRELLVQILAAINPNADLSRFRKIEAEHAKLSPATITASTIKTKIVNGKKIINGKEVGDDESDSAAISGALTTAANIDDIRDKKLKNEYISLAVDSAKNPESKRKISRLLNKTYQNLEKDVSNGDGGDGEGGGNFFSNLINGFFDKRGFGNVSGLFKNMTKALPYLGFGALGFKMFDKMNDGFTRQFNENVETRANVVTNDMRNYPNAALYSGEILSDITAGNSFYQNMGSQIKKFGSSMINKIPNAMRSAGSKMSSMANTFGGKVSGLSNKIAPKLSQSLAGKASKIKAVLKNFVTGLKNNKFLNKIFELFEKALPKMKGKSTEMLKKLFTPARLKMLGRGLVGIGAILDVYGNLVQQLENAGTNFSSELEQALSSGNIGTRIINGFTCISNNVDEAIKNSGDGFAEMLLNSITSTAMNMGLATVFPPYALIKLGLTLLSLILDMIAGEESDPSSIKYFIVKSFKYLTDDILGLDDNLIQTVSETLVDIVYTLGSMLTFSLTKFIASLKELINDIKSLLGGILRSVIFILCDLVMIGLISMPIVGGAVMVFIKMFGAGDALLSLRKEIELLLTGQISFGEFCSKVLSNLGRPIKDALDKIGETFVSAKDWVVDKADRAKNWVKNKWNSITGNGKGRSGRGISYGYGSDLFQENPMYLNSGYNMFDAGCGPIALTAALRQQGVPSTPIGAASMMGKYRDPDGGTHPEGILSIGNKMGGKFSNGSTDVNSIIHNASAGKPVVMMGQSGAFGDGMHYMTAVGTHNGELLVRDPLRPDIRRIHPNDIQGNVASAIYGKGRGGIGGRSGRGFFEFASNLSNMASNFESSVNSMFGSLFGSSDNGSNNESVMEGNTSQPESKEATYVDYTPKQASGDQKSINGKMIYPKEMCKDPGGSFPNPPGGGHSYGQMIQDVKELLIAQYKYTLILPSVVACIMRGETGFGQNAHEKNLGNIMGRGFGTKDVSNNIKDAQMGHVHNYEAYNYWGESIYRIGHLLSHNPSYRGAVGNTDTLSSLNIIGPVYAQSRDWARKMFGFWSNEHMKILQQFDKEAINSMQRSKATGNGKGRNGRGFFEFASNLSNMASNFESSVSNTIGAILGLSSVDANSVPVGDDRNINSNELNSMNDSGGSRMNEPGTTAITKGSTAERVLQYLKRGDPNTHVSLGYQGTAKGLYTSSNRHTGIDFAAAGGTNIYSPVNGTINKVIANVTNADGPMAGGQLGNNVQIKDSQGRVHWFAHMQPGSVGKFSKGDSIKAGDYIGKVGTTGRSTGNHLHYQVNTDGNNYYAVVDPNSVTGMGRKRMFSSNHDSGNVQSGGGIGGASNIDYNSTLDKIYAVLLEIAKNTNVSFNNLNFGNGSGRGSNRSGMDIGAKMRAMNRISNNQSIPLSNPIGIGYQRLVRGYA